MARCVGRVYAVTGDTVYVSRYEGVRVGLGDLLYIKLNGLDEVLVLHVDDVRSELPAGAEKALPLLPAEAPRGFVVESGKRSIVVASPVFLVRRGGDGVSVVRPTEPPELNSLVYLLDGEDEEPRAVMRVFSEGIPSRLTDATVPIGVLRSGTAPIPELRPRKYFRDARLLVDLEELLPKHVVVAGQTGAGKTTSVMGIMVSWALHSRRALSWLVIDRHGEYSRYRRGTRDSFLARLEDALEANTSPEMTGIGIHVYRLTSRPRGVEYASGRVRVVSTAVDVGDLGLGDVATALNLRDEALAELEHILSFLKALVLSSSLREEWRSVLAGPGDELGGQLLPLLVVVVDNMCNYEGVGEREKWGVYAELLRAGIKINKLRTWSSRIRGLLGLRLRRYTQGRGYLTYLSDEHSVFKVSGLLKDPGCIREVLEALASSPILGDRRPTSYPWYRVEGELGLVELISGMRVSDVVEKLEDGAVVVLDVSELPSSQADPLVLSVVRRLFESRLVAGVEEARRRPVVAIVSEEAPLYLSPERVRSPYNPFTRIAREGRKFRVGLIAITQLATMIERQVLANMNTLIVLRTKFRSDIDYLSSIGLRATDIPVLGDREGYIYTPELKVKEPIPAYFTPWFEVEVEGRAGEGEEGLYELLGRL